MNTAFQYTWLIVFLPQTITQFFPDPTSTTPCLLISRRFCKFHSVMLYLAAIFRIEAELFSISAGASDKLLSDHPFDFPLLGLSIPISKYKNTKSISLVDCKLCKL